MVAERDALIVHITGSDQPDWSYIMSGLPHDSRMTKCKEMCSGMDKNDSIQALLKEVLRVIVQVILLVAVVDKAAL
jgi:hypothetical protein